MRKRTQQISNKKELAMTKSKRIAHRQYLAATPISQATDGAGIIEEKISSFPIQDNDVLF